MRISDWSSDVCPALHTIQSKVHACGHNLHAPILRPMKTKAASRAMALRDSLEEEILSGQRPPGARLDESKLAQHFGVSRPPVREALRELPAADPVDRERRVEGQRSSRRG